MWVYTALVQYLSNTEMQYPKIKTKLTTEDIAISKQSCNYHKIFRAEYQSYMTGHEDLDKLA